MLKFIGNVYRNKMKQDENEESASYMMTNKFLRDFDNDSTFKAFSILTNENDKCTATNENTSASCSTTTPIMLIINKESAIISNNISAMHESMVFIGESNANELENVSVPQKINKDDEDIIDASCLPKLGNMQNKKEIILERSRMLYPMLKDTN